MKIKDFINYMLPSLLDECLKRGYSSAVAFTSLSQCALETGWLKSTLMYNYNAPFGIKYHLNNGKFYESPTVEYINGYNTIVNAKFQAYDSIRDAVNDYFNLISSGRYKDSVNAQSVAECITIIKNGGYATDPNYINSILAVYDTIVKNIRN